MTQPMIDPKWVAAVRHRVTLAPANDWPPTVKVPSGRLATAVLLSDVIAREGVTDAARTFVVHYHTSCLGNPGLSLLLGVSSVEEILRQAVDVGRLQP